MPTISPFLTSIETLSTIVRSSSPVIVRFSTFKPTEEAFTEVSIEGEGSSEPTINSANSAAVTSFAGTLVTVFPARSTVMVSAISRTSSSL